MALYWRGISQKGLDPMFAGELESLLGPSPFGWYVLSAYRSPAVQQVLYAQHLAGGPLAAPPGRSAHNFGLAVDVVPDLDNNPLNGLQMNWVSKSAPYLWLKAHTITHPSIQSGWSFKDFGHIERRGWRAAAI